MDAFCGTGGNAVQLAGSCRQVIAVEIDMERLLLAKRNAAVYGVSQRLDFVCGDFLQLAPHFQAGLSKPMLWLMNQLHAVHSRADRGVAARCRQLARAVLLTSYQESNTRRAISCRRFATGSVLAGACIDF